MVEKDPVGYFKYEVATTSTSLFALVYSFPFQIMHIDDWSEVKGNKLKDIMFS